MTKDQKHVQELTAQVLDLQERLGKVKLVVVGRRCSDGNCIWGTEGGMHTNGGCQHDKKQKPELRREIRAIAKELRDAIS